MELRDIFLQVGVSLGLGLLVGLQRERNEPSLAGFRTFPLVTLLGTILALFQQYAGGWLVPAGLLGLVVLIVIGNYMNLVRGDNQKGITTEVALLVMFGTGAFLVHGQMAVAVVTTGAVVALLHFKPELHGIAKKLGDKDFRAIMNFVLIAFVILPILPNENFGPFQALNPFEIWRLVVLIVGISLAGYVVYKFFGSNAGSVMGGILGGLISSTATTVSYARKTRDNPDLGPMATLVIMIASTVVFARVLFLMWLVAPDLLLQAFGPFGTIFGLMACLSMVCWFTTRRQKSEMPEQNNPSELKPALLFAGLFALVLIAVAAAKTHLGNKGLYVVAILSGLTDMDAITVSTSEIAKTNQISASTWWRLILSAAAANLLFKGITAAALGTRARLKALYLLFFIGICASVAVILFWPG